VNNAGVVTDATSVAVVGASVPDVISVVDLFVVTYLEVVVIIIIALIYSPFSVVPVVDSAIIVVLVVLVNNAEAVFLVVCDPTMNEL